MFRHYLVTGTRGPRKFFGSINFGLIRTVQFDRRGFVCQVQRDLNNSELDCWGLFFPSGKFIQPVSDGLSERIFRRNSLQNKRFLPVSTGSLDAGFAVFIHRFP